MDIDWYMIVDDMPIHAASNGGYLQHDLYTVQQLQEAQHLVQELPDDYDFELNLPAIAKYVTPLYEGEEDFDKESLPYQDYLEKEDFHFQDDRYANMPRWLRLYCWSFVDMARKGFYSFDRDEQTDEYFLVAFPVAKSKEAEDEQAAKEYKYCSCKPKDLTANCYHALVKDQRFRELLPSLRNEYFRQVIFDARICRTVRCSICRARYE